jgi:hypothetical protein
MSGRRPPTPAQLAALERGRQRNVELRELGRRSLETPPPPAGDDDQAGDDDAGKPGTGVPRRTYDRPAGGGRGKKETPPPRRSSKPPADPPARTDPPAAPRKRGGFLGGLLEAFE